MSQETFICHCAPRINRGDREEVGVSFKLTTAAVLFALCRLVVAAFALIELRGWLFRAHLGRLLCSRHRNLGELGFGRAATA